MQIKEDNQQEKSGTGAESQPTVENNGPKAQDKAEKSNPSALKSFATRVGLYVLFLAIGALAVALALYLPAASKLGKAQAEVERLSEIEGQYTSLQADYAKVREQSGVYKTISDTSLLEVALTSGETTKVNQQLRYVEEDINALTIKDFPEILQRLQSQFLKIKTNASGSKELALEELGKFYNDLLLLADNLD